MGYPLKHFKVCTAMLDFKAYIRYCNQPERQRPFPAMSHHAANLRQLNLEASSLYLEWMNSGGVSGQRGPEDDTPVEFDEDVKAGAVYANGSCFLKGLNALASAEANDCVQNLVEDFASLPTPSSVAQLPNPASVWGEAGSITTTALVATPGERKVSCRTHSCVWARR